MTKPWTWQIISFKGKEPGMLIFEDLDYLMGEEWEGQTSLMASTR